MAFSFIPKEVDFFALFDKLAGVAVDASVYFKEITSQGKFDEDTVSKMRAIEHSGDDITHDIMKNLNVTFITPFDREDIHALANKLDNVIDMFNAMTNRMKVYRINIVNEDLVQFSHVIESSVRAVANAVAEMRNSRDPQKVHTLCIEIHRLENVGDTMRDSILGRLLDECTDPMKIIKWKEIFESAETVLDVCEDVANVVESIMVKQA